MSVSNHLMGKPVFLLLERERAFVPLNPVGLTVAQNSKRKLKRAYVGERLLGQEGDLYLIRDIIVDGFYGRSLSRRLLSALTGVRLITVELEHQAKPTLEELKILVSRFIQYDYESVDPMLPQKNSAADVLDQIKHARSIEEVFSSFEIPILEDCLDVL